MAKEEQKKKKEKATATIDKMLDLIIRMLVSSAVLYSQQTVTGPVDRAVSWLLKRNG